MRVFVTTKRLFFILLLFITVTLFSCSYFGFGPREISNVVLISIDTCRADYLSCYGYPLKTTPNIDAIADKGILFENVISPVPTTLPSHSSMMTGIIPLSHGVHDNEGYKLRQENLTLAEILKEAGFVTGAVISAFVLDSMFGLNQGFDSYYDSLENTTNITNTRIRMALERTGSETSEIANSWLQNHCNDKFFLFVHYFDPHFPYQSPEPFDSKFQKHLDPFKIASEQEEHSKYAGEIAYVDHCIGQVINKLEELKLYNSTLIIITSDHGEMLFEHNESTHGYFIYQSAIKVPLIFKLPRKRKPIRINQTVGLIDIMPTVCSLLGIDQPKNVQGVDLAQYLQGKSTLDQRALYCESFLPTIYQANPLLGVVTDNWKYIQTTRPELYDLRNDPEEFQNLVSQHKNRARLLQDKLKEILEKSVPDVSIDNKLVLDKENKTRLESLGYIASGMIEESLEFDQSKKDPKDLINYHVLNSQLSVARRNDQDHMIKFLCKRMIQEDPTCLEPYYFLGTLAYEEKDYEKVVEYISRYIEHDSERPGIFNNLGLAYVHLNKHTDAVKNFERALQLEPDSLSTHYNLGREYSRVGKFDKAISHFHRALELAPDDNKANLELNKAITAQQKTENALKRYHDILQKNPDLPAAHCNIAEIYLRQGKKDLAVQYCTKALETNPKSISLRLRIISILLKLDKTQMALAEYNRILEANLNSIKDFTSIAWFQAASSIEGIRNPQQAVGYALKACEVTDNKNPEALDTLAVAYAANGDFQQAIETAQKAIEVANSKGNDALAGRIRKRQDLYKQGKTYLDPQLIPSN